SLKSIGLVRFMHPSHGGRTIRYRHVADERWRLERNELAVLALLVLRGPQTGGELRARGERQFSADGASVEDALDNLAARSPEPFAVQLERRPGERERRWAHLLCGAPDETIASDSVDSVDSGAPASTGQPTAVPANDRIAELEAEVVALRTRLERLERELGIGG